MFYVKSEVFVTYKMQCEAKERQVYLPSHAHYSKYFGHYRLLYKENDDMK